MSGNNLTESKRNECGIGHST